MLKILAVVERARVWSSRAEMVEADRGTRKTAPEGLALWVWPTWSPVLRHGGRREGFGWETRGLVSSSTSAIKGAGDVLGACWVMIDASEWGGSPGPVASGSCKPALGVTLQEGPVVGKYESFSIKHGPFFLPQTSHPLLLLCQHLEYTHQPSPPSSCLALSTSSRPPAP